MKTRTYYPPDALKRLQEIDEYGELTGSSAPVPKPDPRGKNFRDIQKRKQEIKDYEEITGEPSGVPPLGRAMYPKEPTDYEDFYTGKRSRQFGLPKSPKKKKEEDE